MAVGDLKYKFIDKNGEQQEIEVPASALRSGKHRGLSNRETIMEYAANHGYAVDAPKVKSKTTKRGFTRKPDEQKQQLISVIEEALSSFGFINVINAERQLQVDIDGVLFEVTLIKKRTPKK